MSCFSQEAYWTDAAILARQIRMIERASKEITLDSVKKATRMPEPYAMPFKKTINQASLTLVFHPTYSTS